jgi:hypothetical protein
MITYQGLLIIYILLYCNKRFYYCLHNNCYDVYAQKHSFGSKCVAPVERFYKLFQFDVSNLLYIQYNIHNL